MNTLRGKFLPFLLVAPAILVTPSSAEAGSLSADSTVCEEILTADPGDVAVVNITNVRADGDGYGALRSSDAGAVFDRPKEDRYSSVNFARGAPANPNLAFATVGSDGHVCYDGAVASHDVILDLAATIPAPGVEAVDPVRLLDTRLGDPMSEDSTVCVAVPGASDGDSAVVNITPIRARGDGFGTVRSDDGQEPVYERAPAQQFSSVNFSANTPANPNLAVTGLGSGARFCYDGAESTHDVALDLVAVLLSGTARTTDAERLIDTRDGGRLVADSSVCIAVRNADPGDVAVVNITNVRADGDGYGALRSSDAGAVFDRPKEDRYSSVNFARGAPANPNLAFATVGSDGHVCYDGAVASHDVILDLATTIAAPAVEAVDPVRLLDTRRATPITRSGILNSMLPDDTCGSLGDRLGRTLVNGEIRSSQPFGGSIEVRDVAGRVIVRDLDGDGVDDGAFIVDCAGGGTNVDQNVVISVAGREPVVFRERIFETTSSLPSGGWVAGIDELLVSEPSVIGVSWLGNSGDEPNCCPALRFVTSIFVGDLEIVESVEIDPTNLDTIAFGEVTCDEGAMSADLETITVINDKFCEDGWAYVDFCFDGECGFGDSSAVIRRIRETWEVYTSFPTGRCESTARADGMPDSIVDRINWIC